MKPLLSKSLFIVAALTISQAVWAADLGMRSVILNISNLTVADFTTQDYQLETGQWIKGSEPQQGKILNAYETMRIGSYTNEPNSGTQGQLVLTGYGQPFTISYNLSVTDQFSVKHSGNNRVLIKIERVNTGEASHVQANITISDSTSTKPGN